ncbi:hypothetical protein Tco_1461987 [Tanacetum coccineum]
MDPYPRQGPGCSSMIVANMLFLESPSGLLVYYNYECAIIILLTWFQGFSNSTDSSKNSDSKSGSRSEQRESSDHEDGGSSEGDDDMNQEDQSAGSDDDLGDGDDNMLRRGTLLEMFHLSGIRKMSILDMTRLEGKSRRWRECISSIQF